MARRQLEAQDLNLMPLRLPIDFGFSHRLAARDLHKNHFLFSRRDTASGAAFSRCILLTLAGMKLIWLRSRPWLHRLRGR